MVEIRRATEQDGKTLKRVCLAALRDAPYAFGSTYEAERQWDDDKCREWANWGEQGNEELVFLAFANGDRPVGIVGAFKAEEDAVQLIAVWVAPAARRKGFARALSLPRAGLALTLGAGDCYDAAQTVSTHSERVLTEHHQRGSNRK